METVTTDDLSTDNINDSEDHYDVLENSKCVARVFFITVCSVAFLMGTTGNGLVIWFAVFRLKKTVNVMWFLNLAIADFTLTFFVPLSISYIALNYHWPFGTFMCKFNSFILHLSQSVSVLQLTVISIDRSISVVFPVWCQNHRTPKLASITILIIWIISFAFSLPQLIFRKTLNYFDGKIYCYHSSYYDKYITIVIMRSIIFFVFPFTIIVSCYTIIAFRIKLKHIMKSSKPFKIITAVITSFFVCWLPLHIFLILDLIENSYNDVLLLHTVIIGLPVSSSLIFINSCINPIIYVFIGQEIKKKIWSSIQDTFEKAFSEETYKKKVRLGPNTHGCLELN